MYSAPAQTSSVPPIRAILRRNRKGGGAGQVAGRPPPLKIESANGPAAIEEFTTQQHPGNQLRLHGPVVDLFERHAASRHFGVVPAPIRRDREWEPCQHGEQPIPPF